MPDAPDEQADIAAFAARLDAAASDLGTKPDPKDRGGQRGSALGMAFRLSTELVLGLLIGGGMGWFLDQWWGTRPWLMILMFFCGMAAGLKSVLLTAAAMNKSAQMSDKTGPDQTGPGGTV